MLSLIITYILLFIEYFNKAYIIHILYTNLMYEKDIMPLVIIGMTAALILTSISVVIPVANAQQRPMTPLQDMIRNELSPGRLTCELCENPPSGPPRPPPMPAQPPPSGPPLILPPR